MTTVVGFLYPGYAAEDDYPLAARLLRGADVRLPVVHTSMDEDAHRVDALLDLGRDDRLAEGAHALGEQHPDAVVWACTSGSFVFGPQGAQRQVDALAAAAGKPATSTSLAFVSALRHLGANRVAVAATYPQDVATHFRDFLAAAGIEVLGLRSEGIVTAEEVGTLPSASDLVLAGDHPDAEVVLVPDTALHTIAQLPDLETAVAKPVLTANQVSIFEGLRLATGSPPTNHENLGRLFS